MQGHRTSQTPDSSLSSFPVLLAWARYLRRTPSIRMGADARAGKVQDSRGYLRNACRCAGLPGRPPADSSLFQVLYGSA